MTRLLEASGLRRAYAGVVAVDGVSLALDAGEVVGLIGPNGAGKSTVINLLSGFDRPSGGTVLWLGRDVTGRDAGTIAGRGLVRTFQHMRLFRSMTVRENVETAALSRVPNPVFGSLFQLPGYRRARDLARARADQLLTSFGLLRVAGRNAATLPYGTQRRVEIVRALALRPRALLLDEPAAGMDDAESAELAAFLGQAQAATGLAVLLVEHHLDVVMRLCRRIVVLEQGRVIADGAPDQVTRDPAVIDAYLGDSELAS